MRFIEDFLSEKIAVRCINKTEQHIFQKLLTETGIKWIGDEAPLDWFPPREDVLYVCWAKALWITSIPFASDRGYKLINFADAHSEEFATEIPSPVTLLLSKEAPNEPV